MADPTCSCYVCGFPCTDWNATHGKPAGHWLNVCALHNPSESRPNGFMPTSDEGQKIEQFKTEYSWLAKEAKVADPAYPEAPCKTCSRNNDVGNVKIKSCWHCGNLL